MKLRKNFADKGAGSGCMARLVRLRGVGSWWGWRDLAWSALVYWPAGAFWGCCLVHLVLRPALEKNQGQRQQEFRQHQESQASTVVHMDDRNPIFGDEIITVTVDDDAAGGYIVLTQNEQTIRVDLDELQLIAKTAIKMLAQYKKHEE